MGYHWDARPAGEMLIYIEFLSVPLQIYIWVYRKFGRQFSQSNLVLSDASAPGPWCRDSTLSINTMPSPGTSRPVPRFDFEFLIMAFFPCFAAPLFPRYYIASYGIWIICIKFLLFPGYD